MEEIFLEASTIKKIIEIYIQQRYNERKFIIKGIKKMNATKHINELMFKIMNNKNAVDYLFSPDCILIHFLYSDNYISNKRDDLVIDNNTSILACPKDLKFVENIAEDIFENGFNFDSLNPSEKFTYNYDLNILIMKNGASHRLAALYMYLKKYSYKTIVVNQQYLEFKKINNHYLSKLKIDEDKNKVYYLDENGYKCIYSLYSHNTIKFILEIQKKYLGKMNKLSFFDYIKFKFFYKNSPLKKIKNKLTGN